MLIGTIFAQHPLLQHWRCPSLATSSCRASSILTTGGDRARTERNVRTGPCGANFRERWNDRFDSFGSANVLDSSWTPAFKKWLPFDYEPFPIGNRSNRKSKNHRF